MWTRRSIERFDIWLPYELNQREQRKSWKDQRWERAWRQLKEMNFETDWRTDISRALLSDKAKNKINKTLLTNQLFVLETSTQQYKVKVTPFHNSWSCNNRVSVSRWRTVVKWRLLDCFDFHFHIFMMMDYSTKQPFLSQSIKYGEGHQRWSRTFLRSKKVLFRLQSTRSSWCINDGEIILFIWQIYLFSTCVLH